MEKCLNSEYFSLELKNIFFFDLPIIDAPWSRAAPVKLWTRCNRLSRDFAGLAGALVPRATGPFPKLNDKSGAFGWPEK